MPSTEDSQATPSILDLLSQEDFVRGLARSLLRDNHAAEDLVQETWVRALQSPPRHAASLRGWLARIVRNLAANARASRLRRPELIELLELHARSPSTAEVAARRLMNARLALALGNLNAAQRRVIVLRHFEDLPPREIARRVAAPVETVRTRYKRGIAHLRAQLHRDYGQAGATWMLALLAGLETQDAAPGSEAAAPGAPRPGKAAGKTAAASEGLHAIKAGALLVLPLLFGGSLWLWLGSHSSERTSALAGLPHVAAEAALVASSAGSGRAAAATETPPRAARVRVTAREIDSGRPIAELPVQVESAWLAFETAPTVRTDRRGRASIDDLQPGTYALRPARGRAVVRTLVEGEHVDLDLWIPAGREVQGRVVDAGGRPVAGAAILVSLPEEPARCSPAASSDADGAFRLAAVDQRAWICARKEGFADTELLYLDDPGHRAPGREVVLRCRFPSSRLALVVRDERDRPIEGARVRVALGRWQLSQVGVDVPSWPEVRLDGTLAINPPPREAVTDAAGRVEIDGLLAGAYTLAVDAEGFAPWGTDVAVDTAPAPPTAVVLQSEARIAGELRTPEGKPAAGAVVEVVCALPAMTRSVACDRKGRFELGGLPIGKADLQAWLLDADLSLHAATSLSTLSGESVAWNARLEPGGSILGLAESTPGEPLAGWIVSVEREDALGPHGSPTLTASRVGQRLVSTDAAGRFALPGCLPGTYHVTLFDPGDERGLPLAWQLGVSPGTAPVLLRVSAAGTTALAGRLVDARGKPAMGIELVVDSLVLPRQLRLALGDDGRFAIEDLPPGQFTLRAWGDGVPLQPVGGGKLGAGERKQLGDLALLESGYVELNVRSPDGAPPAAMTVTLRVDGSKPLACSSDGPLPGFAFGEEGSVRIGPLPRGRYGVRVQSGDELSRLQKLVVWPGRTERLELELQSSPPLSFRLLCPERERRRGGLAVQVFEPSGDHVDERLLAYSADEEKVLTMEFRLPLGEYELRAVIDGALLARVPFVHDGTADRPMEIDLR